MPQYDYIYLRAWDRMMCSTSGWTQLNLERAREENAPPTAIYKRSDGSWATYEGIVSADTKQLITRLAEQYSGTIRP